MRAEVLLANLAILAGDTASSVHHQRRAVAARPESFRPRNKNERTKLKGPHPPPIAPD